MTIGHASIDSSAGYAFHSRRLPLLSNADSQNRFCESSDVEIKAPSDNKSVSTIFAALYRLPKDKNTGNSVLVETKTTQQTCDAAEFLYALSFKIVEPSGAVIMWSHAAEFVIQTQIRSKTRKIYGHARFTGSYKTRTNPRSRSFTDLFWQVTDPLFRPPVSIHSNDAGRRGFASGPGHRAGMSAAFSITTVTPAKLTLDLSVLGPVDVLEDNTVSPGQEFWWSQVVQFRRGDTVGSAGVTLEPLPPDTLARTAFPNPGQRRRHVDDSGPIEQTERTSVSRQG